MAGYSNFLAGLLKSFTPTFVPFNNTTERNSFHDQICSGMKPDKILHRTALLLFDLLCFLKGYRFARVTTPEQESDFDQVYREDGLSFSPEIVETLSHYKGTISFVAYYKSQPVGVVRLADPKITNRPRDLHGVDAAGEHFEIQSLAVRKSFRESSQFVMLGLFKTIYCYSLGHDIASWICCSSRNVFLTMRRYCKDIQLIEVDFEDRAYPVSQYLFARNVFNTCYSMQVEAFSPWNIFKNFIRFKTRNSGLFFLLKQKLAGYESLGYGLK